MDCWLDSFSENCTAAAFVRFLGLTVCRLYVFVGLLLVFRIRQLDAWVHCCYCAWCLGTQRLFFLLHSCCLGNLYRQVRSRWVLLFVFLFVIKCLGSKLVFRLFLNFCIRFIISLGKGILLVGRILLVDKIYLHLLHWHGFWLLVSERQIISLRIWLGQYVWNTALLLLDLFDARMEFYRRKESLLRARKKATTAHAVHNANWTGHRSAFHHGLELVHLRRYYVRFVVRDGLRLDLSGVDLFGIRQFFLQVFWLETVDLRQVSELRLLCLLYLGPRLGVFQRHYIIFDLRDMIHWIDFVFAIAECV